MCGKCYAMNNTCMGRYGAIMQAYKDGTYNSEKSYIQEEVCEEYKKMMKPVSASENKR